MQKLHATLNPTASSFNRVPFAMLMKSVFLPGCTCCVLSIALVGLTSNAAFSAERYTEKPGTEGNGNFVIGPDYKIDPDLTDRGNPKGKYFEFSMRLADSKIFRGDDRTLDPKKPVRKERKIFVYVPAAYKDGTKAPILVMHDGPSRLKLVRNALDNLTISKDPKRRLPAFIAIAVQNGGNDSYGSQRGLEYDTMSGRFARFINDEVLPAVLNDAKIKAAYPNIAFTKNPWGKAAMGCSSGGAAALTMGWFRPDLFRRLITYSGTFVDQQDDDAAEEAVYPLGAWEYHSGKKLIENSKKKPLRIFTHVSEHDIRAKDPEKTYHNWVMANRRTAAALKAKGYDYRFVFSRATRHCDRQVFEQTLADTLVWMWRGYHALAAEPPNPEPILKFNGKDLTGFYSYFGKQRGQDPDKVFSVTPEGWLRISGRHRGYLSTEKPLENYRLVAEFKWISKDAKSDSGIFFNAVKQDKLWAKSMEFQMRTGATGDLCLIGGTALTANGKRHTKGCIKRSGKGELEKPKGQWNTVEIVSTSDKVQMRLNGKLILDATEPSLTKGRVYFQCYAGGLIYRKIVLYPLKTK